jgi:hypothetical protein
VLAIVGDPGGSTFAVLFGLSHRGLSVGSVLTVTDADDAVWRRVLEAELRVRPEAYYRDSRGVLIKTQVSVERVRADGTVEILARQ